MDESWNHLQNLEAHIKEHNSHIEKITPLRTKQHSRQSSLIEDLTKRSSEVTSTAKMLSMAKEIREKDLEIMYLKRDVASLEIFKDQCANMQSQVKLLREKAVLCERESQSKTYKLSSLETTAVPRLEKVEVEMRELKAVNENLQSLVSQVKKELDEKSNQLAFVKQNYAGQDSTIKGLEEEKRSLKGKLAEMQMKLDELIKQHEKNKEYLKQKEQLSLALEEDNERLRAQIENTMESLQKCQYEISLLPMLRQDVHHREQLISTASREIEREKSLRQKVSEEKDKLELQISNLYEITEGTDPFEYLQELKEIISKSKKEHMIINEELLRMKETHYKFEKENSELLQYTSSCIENFCKDMTRCLFENQEIEIPDLDESVKPVIQLLYIKLRKVKDQMDEIVCELQDTNSILNEKNNQIRKRMEETDEMIIKQEFLTEQLTAENKKIKQEIEILKEDFNETIARADSLEGELKESIKTNEALKKNYNLLKKELEDKVVALSSVKNNFIKQENLIEQIDDEKRYIESERNTLENQIKVLESQKNISEKERENLLKKFSEIQKEFENFLNQHEKNTRKVKEQDGAICDLKDDNDRLNEEIHKLTEINKKLFEENERMSKELENQIDKIEECTGEILTIPKLKQELNIKTQQLISLTLELEKERENFESEKKTCKKLKATLSNLKSLSENKDPSEYIQSLSSDLKKLNQENSSLKSSLETTENSYQDLKKSSEKFEESLIEMIKNESEKAKKQFLSQLVQSSYEGKVKKIYSLIFNLVEDLQKQANEKISELEENAEYLNDQISGYENNMELWKKVEHTNELIEAQEMLSKKLSAENLRLREDLDFAKGQIDEYSRNQEELEDKIRDLTDKNLKNKKKVSTLEQELNDKSKLLSSLSNSTQKQDSIISQIESENFQLQEKNQKIYEKMQILKEEKKILTEEKAEVDGKILKLQNEFDKIFESQDSNLQSITNKKDLISAMVEDNKRLKKHVENLMQILKKYRT